MNKIFCIGLPKTATLSLHFALQHLGYTSSHYPQIAKIIGGVNGKLELGVEEVDKHDAISDLPVAYFYKKLDQFYPGSKFICTIRDQESWLDSASRHFKDPRLNFGANRMLTSIFSSSRFHKDWWINGYKNHISGIAQHFKDRKEDLMFLNICGGDGWIELCSFLKKEVPKIETFPDTNKGINK